MKKIAKPVLYKDFLEHITKEQKELDESMKEAFRQRDERLNKQRQTESEKMQEELEPIGILKRGRTSWAMDVNFRFPRGKQRDGKKK